MVTQPSARRTGSISVVFVELEDIAAACGKPLEFFRTRPED
jgi:hypothetical protein